jgi:L-Ala-D/L-Glu epimerase
LRFSAAIVRFPIRGVFAIARGSRTEAVVVEAQIEADGLRGRGECVPYPRYGESPESVLAQLESVRAGLAIAALSTLDARSLLPAGAARHALDAALIDWQAKMAGKSASACLGLPEPLPVITAFTISLEAPAEMEAAARAAADRPLLKIKLGTAQDMDRLRAVRQGAPESTLIVDANEGWHITDLDRLLPEIEKLGVALIEQPLPAGRDDDLRSLASPVPLCADESVHTAKDIAALADRYDAVNIKLDKTGGLREAIDAVRQAEAAGLDIMIGCMVGSSLAMAPAALLTPFARYVDLDGPLLLAADREPGLRYDGSRLHPLQPALWG